MKKIISAVATVYITVVALLNCCYAQTQSNTVAVNVKNAGQHKAAIANTDNNATEAIKNLNGISPAAVKAFEKKFKNIAVDYWNKLTDGYEARFEHNGIKNKAFFNEAGVLVYVMKYYSESQLAADIRAIVKSVYYDYSIFLVEELQVIADKNAVYIIHMEDKTSWTNVTVCNGEMNVLKEMTK